MAINRDTFGSFLITRRSSYCGIAVGKVSRSCRWPGRKPSGELVVADSYQPETVTRLRRFDGTGRSLRMRSTAEGCHHLAEDLQRDLPAEQTLSARDHSLRPPAFQHHRQQQSDRALPLRDGYRAGAFMASGDQTPSSRSVIDMP